MLIMFFFQFWRISRVDALFFRLLKPKWLCFRSSFRMRQSHSVVIYVDANWRHSTDWPAQNFRFSSLQKVALEWAP